MVEKMMTVAELINEQLKQCSCNRDRAIFFCDQKCSNNQQVYCMRCSKDHPHAPIPIDEMNANLAKKWALFFEKVESLYQAVQKIYSPYEEVVRMIEGIYKEKVSNEPQHQFFSDMYNKLTTLYSYVIGQKQEEIEKHVSAFSITEILKLETKFQQYNITYESVKPLESFKKELLYDRYKDAFQYKFPKKKLKNLKNKKFLYIMELKKKYMKDIDPQEQGSQLKELILEYFEIEKLHNQIITNNLRKECGKLNQQVKLLEENNHISAIVLNLRYDPQIPKIVFNWSKWDVLFGVNAFDKFDYNHQFWTQKQEMNTSKGTSVSQIKYSFKLKTFWEKKIKKLLILSQSGHYTILEMPCTDKSLMDYFLDEDTVSNLKYISGAKDPVELINKKQGIKFYEQVWRINSKMTNGYKFMTRLGGYYYDVWGKDESWKDNKQQVIGFGEMAGFGIFDQLIGSSNRVYGNKSFGIRTQCDNTSGQGQVQIGAIVCAL